MTKLLRVGWPGLNKNTLFNLLVYKILVQPYLIQVQIIGKVYCYLSLRVFEIQERMEALL